MSAAFHLKPWYNGLVRRFPFISKTLSSYAKLASRQKTQAKSLQNSGLASLKASGKCSRKMWIWNLASIESFASASKKSGTEGYSWRGKQAAPSATPIFMQKLLYAKTRSHIEICVTI